MHNRKRPTSIPYQAPMLPEVDYQKIVAGDALFSLTGLEQGTEESALFFLEAIQPFLLEEKCVPSLPFLVGHLCVYLSATMTLYTVHAAEHLEPLVIALIEQQTKTAYQYFSDYPINRTAKTRQEKEKNLTTLYNITPGNILMRTLRLEEVIMEMMEALVNNQLPSTTTGQSPHVMLSNEMLIKMVLYLSSKECPKWREQLDGLSDNYVINQQAIQLGWLIGCFLHQGNHAVENNPFFEVGFPLIRLYRDHIYRLMKVFAEAKHAQEHAQEIEKKTHIESLLTDIHQLSEKTQSQTVPAITPFQKQFLMAKADIEKTLISLLEQGCAIKIMVMSLFYFWFTLAAPLYHRKSQSMEDEDPLSHLTAIIALVKKTVKDLPAPEFSSDVHQLNEKMQALKQYASDPEKLDDVPHDEAIRQTPLVNTAIHTVSSDYLQQDFHPEAVANALFSHWLRLSVFFGISENEWQKMDYYFVEILHAVEQYIATIATEPKGKTASRTSNDQGRNNVCPCGSGKKYKKCCL
ncbi:MAG: hypothetical protein HKM04_05530 [Legionellales bacterium]|nr:hypothetical protein [Legionellales bacterium]